MRRRDRHQRSRRTPPPGGVAGGAGEPVSARRPVGGTGAPPRATALLAVARRHRLTPLVSVLSSAFSSVPGGGLPAVFAEACRRDRVITAARNLMLGAGSGGVPARVRGRRRSGHRAQGARVRAHALFERRRAADRGRRPAGPRRGAARRLRRAGPSRFRAARRRAGVRRRRLSRGGMDAAAASRSICTWRWRRTRAAAIDYGDGLGARGRADRRAPRPRARSISDTPPSFTRCTWRSTTSTCRRSTSSIFRGSSRRPRRSRPPKRPRAPGAAGGRSRRRRR